MQKKQHRQASCFQLRLKAVGEREMVPESG